MANSGPPGPPRGWLWLIRAASWIVPAGVRSDWRRKRLEEVRHWWAFLAERGEESHGQRLEVLRHCRRSFSDAFKLRFLADRVRERTGQFARGPVFAVVVCILPLAAIVLAGGFFSDIRKIYTPLPYGSGRLAMLSYAGGLGYPLGVPAQDLLVWRERSKSVEGLAYYVSRPFNARRAPEPGEERDAQVSPDFFQVLGVRALLGRTLQPEDAPGATTNAVLSHFYWQERFGGDAGILGKTVTLGERRMRIVGVLPAEFWFRSRNIHYWTPLWEIEPKDRRLRLYGAVARLRQNVTMEQAQEELRRLAQEHSGGSHSAGVRLFPVEHPGRSAMRTYVVGLVLALLLAAVIALVQISRAWWVSTEWKRRATAIRYWTFFSLKTVLPAAAWSALCAQIVAANAVSLNPVLGLSLIVSILYLLGLAGIVRFSYVDQRLRCPVCLRSLAMPVTMGSWSSWLLEPASTEFLCEQGHGSLYVSETHSSGTESEKWENLDDSWRDLFKK
jgi:MacB-like protein